MGTPEQLVGKGAGDQSTREVLDPRHLYGAYVFDETNIRKSNIVTLMEQAQQLGYQVRYWWLSEVKELEGYPDFLMVGVHYPSAVEDAGLELHEVFRDNLTEKRVTWDDIAAVAVDEYRQFGKPIKRPESIFEPDGTPLFPEPETDPEVLYTITKENVQLVAQGMLGRELTGEEMEAVADGLQEAVDWITSVEIAIELGQNQGKVGPAADGHEV